MELTQLLALVVCGETPPDYRIQCRLQCPADQMPQPPGTANGHGLTVW